MCNRTIKTSAIKRSVDYWNIIQIVIFGVIAILILLFIWRLAECAGLMGRMGMLGPTTMFWLLA